MGVGLARLRRQGRSGAKPAMSNPWQRPNTNAGPPMRGPKPVSEILGELFAARGLARLRARGELEDAWNTAVGEPACRQTRLGEVRRGVLNVTVAHPVLLEELAVFEKPRLLAALRENAPGTLVHDIRFRVGSIDAEPAANDQPPARPRRPPPPSPDGRG